jgi:hypothetical protein
MLLLLLGHEVDGEARTGHVEIGVPDSSNPGGLFLERQRARFAYCPGPVSRNAAVALVEFQDLNRVAACRDRVQRRRCVLSDEMTMMMMMMRGTWCGGRGLEMTTTMSRKTGRASSIATHSWRRPRGRMGCSVSQQERPRFSCSRLSTLRCYGTSILLRRLRICPTRIA